jgi:biotin carboxyl carrier protein
MEAGRPQARTEEAMKFTATVEGERVEVEVVQSNATRVEGRIAGRSYVLEVAEVGPGVYWFNWNNRSIEVTVTPAGDAYAVSISQRHVSVEIVDARTALRKAAHQSADGVVELRAPMPGKVVKVLVDEGAQVQAHQGVLVVEAMKMQNEIKSPKSGIVKKIRVANNAAVNAGDVLAVVE